jgi:predicted nucleic-acid-binding Zn-ribbon protein
MDNCKKCGNGNASTIVYFTETTFGHGDSTHRCYVKCLQCGNTSKEESNWGIFEMSTFRKAQQNWIEENKD